MSPFFPGKFKELRAVVLHLINDAGSSPKIYLHHENESVFIRKEDVNAFD